MDFIFTFGFTGTGTVSAVKRLGKKNCITFLLFCLRRVTGAVTNALTGETQDAVCHVIVGGNNVLKKFDLELIGG